jgi:hypothetical protein
MSTRGTRAARGSWWPRRWALAQGRRAKSCAPRTRPTRLGPFQKTQIVDLRSPDARDAAHAAQARD